ncbi:MAG: hypothetical protein V7754_00285 [Halioglobus sp.]
MNILFKRAASKVLASGSYQYLLNGRPAPVEESWRYEGDLAGECRIFGQRVAIGVEIEVSALMCQGKVLQFDTLWRGNSAGIITAHYRQRDDGLSVNWSGAGSDREEVIEIRHETEDSEPLLFPLMRIFTGPLIARLVEQGGAGRVILPNIENPAAPEVLLRPQVSERKASIIEEDKLTFGDGSEVLCRCCEYTGDQYSADSRFWLGPDDMLQRYQWQQTVDQRWDVWLQP